MEHGRVGETRSLKSVVDRMQRGQIVEGGATGYCDLVRLGIDLGQLMARVVALELGFFPGSGAKEIDPPSCRIIFGTALRSRPI